jgi:hypothetical protein
MTTELEKVPTEVLLRATFAAQREAHSAATNREDLDLLARLIQSELLAVSGVYERERRHWDFKEKWASKEYRTSQAQQEATIVAKRVAIRFAAEMAAAENERQVELDRNEVLVLRVDEVFATENKWHGADPAPSYRRLLSELVSHPGWNQDSLFSRLIEIEAVVKPRHEDERPVAEFGGRWGTYDTAPDLEIVVLRRDGSGFLEFKSGERRTFTQAKHPFRQNPFLSALDDVAEQRDPHFDFDYWLELDDWCAEKYHRNRTNPSAVDGGMLIEKGESTHE